MPDIIAPIAYAAVVWWFTTGLILVLDGMPQRTFRWSMTAATILALVASYVLCNSAEDTTVRGAYLGFTCAILIWGWLEMSFLMGFVTGSRTHACVERCSGWKHVVHATEAIIYNEIATVLCGAAIIWTLRHAANQTALWTFVIMWSMRISAKLNLFLGVPNTGEKFLPVHLQYLKSFFRKRPMNLLLPLSVTASTAATALLLRDYVVAANPFRASSDALMASLLALAVLEHWFMVIPLPSEKLWRWANRREPQSPDEGKIEPGMAAK